MRAAAVRVGAVRAAADTMDPTSEVSRFEEKIRREEAKVQGAAELASSSLDAQFNTLDDVAKTTEVDARLAAIKSGAGARR